MKEERLVVGPPVAKVEGERLAAVGAGRLDPAVRVERGADAERVPGAVAIPPATAGADAVGGRYDRARVEHSELFGTRVEDDCVLGVQTAPALEDLVRVAEFGGCRGAAVLHEERIGAAA